MKNVALIKGENRRKAVKAAVDALGQDFYRRAQQAEYILIKPDLVHHSLQLASTHVDAVRGVLDLLKMYSSAPVIIGDVAQYGTKQAFRNLEYESLVSEYKNVNLVDLSEDEAVEMTVERKDGTLLVARRSKIAMEAPLTISLASIKTHHTLVASLGILNWVEGTWLVPPRMTQEGKVWSRDPWLYALGREDAERAVADLFLKNPCHVSVIDGILAMEGDGPINGEPVHMGVFLAGTDPVAVDTVGATLMGLDAHSLPYLEYLASQGLGTNEISEIDVPLHALQECTKIFRLS